MGGPDRRLSTSFSSSRRPSMSLANADDMTELHNGQ
jgi:hypothetical protein